MKNILEENEELKKELYICKQKSRHNHQLYKDVCNRYSELFEKYIACDDERLRIVKKYKRLLIFDLFAIAAVIVSYITTSY